MPRKTKRAKVKFDSRARESTPALAPPPVVETQTPGQCDPTLAPYEELRVFVRTAVLALGAVVARLEHIHQDIQTTNPRMYPIKATTKTVWGDEVGRAIQDAKAALEHIPRAFGENAA